MVTYPSDWKTDKISNVAELFDNLRIPVTKSQRKPGSTPYYGANGIQDFVNGYTHDGEFVLIAEDGANDLLNYPVAYVNGRVWINNHAHVLAGIKSVANTKFLSYLLKKVDYTAILVGGTRAKLNGKTLKEIEITFPEQLSEQHAIASVLSDFDEHIDNLTELIEKKKAIREGALEDLLSGRTRLDGFDGEWEEKSFKDLGDILTGLTYSPDNIRPSGKLVIRSSNVQDDRLSFEDNVFVDRTCVISEDIKKGDIIICVRNGSASLIGKSAYASSDLDATFGAFMSNFRCKNHDSSGFVYYFTKSAMFKNFVKQILGATINQITKTDLKRVTLNIPVDIEEQQAIAQVLTAIDEEIDSLEIEKAKMMQIREGAMDDLLTGRVRLKV
jgi:type I restriction enzyme S subunit